MICMKNLRSSSHPREKVRYQGPPGSTRAQPCPSYISCCSIKKSHFDKTIIFENTNEKILLLIIGEKGPMKEVEQVRS